MTMANPPIEIEKSEFWWKATKTSTENLIKSIKIKWNKEATIKTINKTLNKVKELTPKINIETKTGPNKENISMTNRI